MHAILIGPDANHPALLGRLKELFIDYGGMGRFLNLEAKPEVKNPKHAVRYMMKYVSKLPKIPGGTRGFLPKGGRLFTESVSLREWFKKKIASMFFAVAMGDYILDAPRGEQFREATWEAEDYRMGRLPPPPGFQECMDFFGEIIRTQEVLNQQTFEFQGV
jgi:hypothetical protein